MATPTHDPMPAGDPPQPVDRDPEVIVTQDGRRSGVSTAVLATIAVLAVLLFAWLAFGGTSGDDVDAVVPAESEVDTNDSGTSTDTTGETGEADTTGETDATADTSAEAAG